MTTAEELGMIKPVGTDLISGGDNAISRNADRTAVIYDELMGKMWSKGQISYATHPGLDSLPEGFSALWFRADAPKYGLPMEAIGTFHVYPYGGQKQVKFLTYNNGRMEEYAATKLSAAWSAWTLLNQELPSSAGGLFPATKAGLKSVGIPCTLGKIGSTTTGQGFARLLQRMPANATRYRVRLRNWNPRFNLDDSPAVALSNIAIGLRNGSTATSWSTIDSTGTTGATGYVSRWNTVPAALKGQDVLLAYGWQSAGDVQETMGTAYTGTSAAGALTDTGTKTGTAPLFAVLEVEIPATQPVAAVIGDSIASGTSSTNPVYDSWLDQWGRANGVVVTHWSHSGDAASRWLDPDSGKWTLYGDQMAPADACFYAMGSNDIFASEVPTLAALQADLREVVKSARKHISPNLYAVTITPRNSVTGTAETRRREFNTWLSLSGEFRDVFNVAAAISADDETIRPEFNADGVHFNTAGYAAMAAAINRPVVRPANEYQVSETAGRTVSVWDYLNNRDQLIYGDTGERDIRTLFKNSTVTTAVLVREENRVFLSITGLDVASTATPGGELLQIPSGFKSTRNIIMAAFDTTGKVASLFVNTVGRLGVWTGIGDGSRRNIDLSWRTNDPWPTTLPGVAA